jgi:RecQ family ATP-dependent DNA helicase
VDLHLEGAAGPPRPVDPARLRAYARWTLNVEGEPEVSTVRGLAARLLLRGPLAAPTPSLRSEARRAHRLQVAALLGAPAVPERLSVEPDLEPLVEPALRDLNSLLLGLESLYGEKLERGGTLYVSERGAGHPRLRSALISESWDGEQRAWRPEISRRRAEEVRPEVLRWFLRWLFAHEDFRPGQAEAIASLLKGQDAAAALPTGSGKSVIYQLAALLSPGTAIVAQPLLALIDDQLRGLEKLGLGLAGGGSDLERLASGELALFYACPERLESAAFRQALRGCVETCGVSFAVVDEAHCVTQWGHDFRPAYRHLGRRLAKWTESPEGRAPVLALSGTATALTMRRACETIGMAAEPFVERGRPLDIKFEAVQDGLERLKELARENRARPGIVFCQAVDGKRGAFEVAEELSWMENHRLGCFTGRAPAGWEDEAWRKKKREEAERFLSGKLDLMVATSAFGMGVHRADVRWTVHLGLPLSLEALEQEAGRAGRDGLGSTSWVLIEPGAEKRALFLHERRFPGLAVEKEEVAELVLRLPWGSGRAWLEAGAQCLSGLERCADRLSMAGLLEVTERRPGALGVELDLCGKTEALMRAELAVERVYAILEPERRRALAEVARRRRAC